MANERRGILFEAITDVALRKAIKIANIPGQVFWNEKPEKMSMTPDFTIGEDKNQPNYLILVTASGSARNSEIKSWRNLGEMQEAKAQLPNSCTVINLYFKSEVKQGLATITPLLYDAVLHTEAKPYHKVLEHWVDLNLQKPVKTRDEKRLLVESAIETDLELNIAVTTLAQDLAKTLLQEKTDLTPLWELMREDYQKQQILPSARLTSVRRGLGKLLILEPEIRQQVYNNYKKSKGLQISRETQAEYLVNLGLFKKTLIGLRGGDDEIRQVIDLLGPEKCETILKRSPSAMMTWINPLRDLTRVETHLQFVEEHYEQFIEPLALKKLLETCYHSPSDLSGVAGDEKVWVFEIMISLFKAKSGMRQGYGLAQLAQDTGLAERGRGAPLLRFIIPKFVQREELPRPEYLIAIASGLAKRFQKTITRSDISRLKDEVVASVIKENLEDRLIPYRNFEPLLWLLEAELKKAGKAYSPKAIYEGWIGEYADVGRGSATTPFVKVGNTLIHWKTVSDAGKGHKKKELAARARSIKYQYDPRTKTFTRRKEVDRLALIVDGTFDEEDLKILAEAGWDIIVYPDEIADLVNKL